MSSSPPVVSGPVTVTGSPPSRSPARTATAEPAQGVVQRPHRTAPERWGAVDRDRPGAKAATAVTKRDVVPASPASSVTSRAAMRPPEPTTTRVVTRGVDRDAEAIQAPEHGDRVVAAGEAVQPAVAVGERGAHERPVGDALGPGHVDDGVERAPTRSRGGGPPTGISSGA